jgi:hypothetical protein
VRASLLSTEDSLVLDLILGYRQRVTGGKDLDVEHRARGAVHQLEYMLRHGGIKSRGGEARVIMVQEPEKLTVRETVDQLSEALLQNTPGIAWRPEAERAREIQRRRGDLSALVEDADWVLTLTAELESRLAPEEKARLRRLHETYAARAPHAVVAAQVNSLLTDIRDERLRRELKKLANRSWERERRAKADPPAPKPPVTPLTPVAPVTQEEKSPPPLSPNLPAPAPATRAPVPVSVPDAVPTTEPGATTSARETSPDTTVTPERYCAERRTEAAQAFAAARGANEDTAKTRFLRQSLELLDDCLNRHPDSPEAEKARQNRARVEQELKR